MKYFSAIIAVLSIMLVSFVYFKYERDISNMQDRMENLDHKLETLSDDLETRIAVIRSQMPRPSTKKPETRATEAIRSLVSTLESAREKPSEGEDLLERATDDLGLTGDEKKAFEIIITRFNEFKRQRLTSPGEQGPGFLYPENIQSIREESREVHKELRDLLTPSQYQQFMDLEYDVRLGLGRADSN